MTRPLIWFHRLGWVLSAFFSYIISFNDLINSQCFTYYSYMEDKMVLFLDMSSLLSKAGHQKHTDGRRQAEIQACTQGTWKSGSRIQVFGPKIQDPDSSSKGSSERKRIMEIPKESKYKAGTWPKERGSTSEGAGWPRAALTLTPEGWVRVLNSTQPHLMMSRTASQTYHKVWEDRAKGIFTAELVQALLV